MSYNSQVKILFILIYHCSALCQLCIYSQKCSLRWASLPPKTCRTYSNRSIGKSIKEICCILLVAYIVVLMMHGLTDVKSKRGLCLYVRSAQSVWCFLPLICIDSAWICKFSNNGRGVPGSPNFTMIHWLRRAPKLRKHMLEKHPTTLLNYI